MSSITKSRRRQRRYSISATSEAFVEFASGGRSYRLLVLNMSASGLSFAVDPDDPVPGLEEGTTLTGVAVRVGTCTMNGELLVMHVTSGPDSRYVCGSLFYPATDTDLLKLKSVIAGMEIAGTD